MLRFRMFVAAVRATAPLRYVSMSTSASVIQLAATCAFGAVAELDLVRRHE